MLIDGYYRMKCKYLKISKEQHTAAVTINSLKIKCFIYYNKEDIANIITSKFKF